MTAAKQKPQTDDVPGPLRRALRAYDEPLLRRVAARLARTRNQWPADELIARCAAAVGNAAALDRRLKELDLAARQLLACVGHSRQPRWRLGSLVELAMALGQADGLKPVLSLLEAGLLYPDLPEGATRLKSFEQWLGQAGGACLDVFAHPAVAARAVGEELDLPVLSSGCLPAGGGQEADGLDWPLRLAVLWQRAAQAPLRRTQSGDFFKRDLDRLGQDALLGGPGADGLAELPDPAFLAVALAECLGVVRAEGGEVRAGEMPAHWEEGLLPALASLWAALPCVQTWGPLDGWRGGQPAAGNPFASACLLALLLLVKLPADGWARAADLERWAHEHHPYWAQEAARPSRRRPWLEAFLLGVAYPLRLVQAARGPGEEWLVRLTPVGRWLLGRAGPPAPAADFPRTLLVQPNLEIVAYRQGLTPGLIGRLSRFAAWKSLGPACTLQIEAEAVYRALESGLTFDAIVQTLGQYGTRPTPGPVVETLRTWSNKRDRIRVYASAALLEFARPEDLEEALARGLPAVRLSDRLAVVAREDDIDFRHFRLTGTRDYGLPPEKCVAVEPDGVTLGVDVARSDLLLETELPRFAEPAARAPVNGRRQYALTPASLAQARAGGLSLAALEAWFEQRTGGPVPPAARLLFTGAQLPAPRLRRHLVLHVAAEPLADGLLQWPETRPLLAGRLGPTALVVDEESLPALREKLRALGVPILRGD